jgi:hypothetical protein
MHVISALMVLFWNPLLSLILFWRAALALDLECYVLDTKNKTLEEFVTAYVHQNLIDS